MCADGSCGKKTSVAVEFAAQILSNAERQKIGLGDLIEAMDVVAQALLKADQLHKKLKQRKPVAEAAHTVSV